MSKSSEESEDMWNAMTKEKRGNFLVHELKEGEQRGKWTRCPLKGPCGKKFRLYSKIKGKGKMIERLSKVLILLFSFRTALWMLA